MAAAGTLHDAFIDELREIYDAERRLLKAQSKMAKVASHSGLKQAFEAHLADTRGHVESIEKMFGLLDEKARRRSCDSMASIIKEVKSLKERDFDAATKDACVIATAQRIEHYEIATYGTLVAWARAMGRDEVGDLLEEILVEERAADEALTEIAESHVNDHAAAAGTSDNENQIQRRRPRATSRG